MPKARRRKNTAFQSSMTKSVFLYGEPNKNKRLLLQKIQDSFAELVNEDIRMLDQDPSIIMQIVKNDKKDPDMRKLEKSIRKPGLNSAFCQNAFDTAVTHLSNRINDIRIDLLSEGFDIFAKSKVLFAMSLSGRSRSEMIAAMEQLNQEFHEDCAKMMRSMTDQEFHAIQTELKFCYQSAVLERKLPQLRTVSVPLDSRLMSLEPSTNTRYPYVISITDPFKKNHRIQIPINTSAHSLHKIQSYKMAGTVMMQMRKDKLRIGWSYDIHVKQPKTSNVIGVDTGITDALYISDGRAIGSMKEVLDFYHDVVEPAFAELSALRNKKRAISAYVRHHDLSTEVRTQLIQKMDRLEHMIQTMEAPYRKKRHYYAMLDQTIVQAVRTYVESLDNETLTVLEKLDIKEFHKSRTVNGMFSTFARGKLQQKLMQELNLAGKDFVEILPDYTSQVCPICGNLNPNNRHGKNFTCTCCGHHDDADHVASINIKARVNDMEIQELCEKYQYNHVAFQKELKDLYQKRHDVYMQQQAA